MKIVGTFEDFANGEIWNHNNEITYGLFNILEYENTLLDFITKNIKYVLKKYAKEHYKCYINVGGYYKPIPLNCIGTTSFYNVYLFQFDNTCKKPYTVKELLDNIEKLEKQEDNLYDDFFICIFKKFYRRR